MLIDTLINFISIGRDHLELSPPVQIKAGVANVHGVRLAVDPNHFAWSNFEGKILRHAYSWEATLDNWSIDPFDFLLPFFNKIYDIAGLNRPSTRTAGRRQR